MNLGEVVQAVRFRSPHYGNPTVPNRVLLEAATRIQRSLSKAAAQLNRTYLSQTFSIGFDLSTGNLPGTAGNGTQGGLPAEVDASGTLSTVEQTVGGLLHYDLTNAVERVSTRPVGSATSGPPGTLTDAGSPGWTVNAWANKLVEIMDGPDEGDLQKIASNTASALTLGPSTVTWEFNLPTSASTYRIIEVPDLDTETAGVVTALPGFSNVVGYLVRLDASGNPYVDYSQPVVTKVEDGIPLPPFERIIGGSVILSGLNPVLATSDLPGPIPLPVREFHLLDYSSRLRSGWYSGHLLAGRLFLHGTSTAWTGIQSIDLRVVPIPPAFTSTAAWADQTFLLPDTAFEVMVAELSVVAAQWAVGKGVQNVDVNGELAERKASRDLWLRSVSQQQQVARRSTTRIR